MHTLKAFIVCTISKLHKLQISRVYASTKGTHALHKMSASLPSHALKLLHRLLPAHSTKIRTPQYQNLPTSHRGNLHIAQHFTMAFHVQCDEVHVARIRFQAANQVRHKVSYVKKIGCDTGTSREVTHPSTIPAHRRLTAEF